MSAGAKSCLLQAENEADSPFAADYEGANRAFWYSKHGGNLLRRHGFHKVHCQNDSLLLR